MDALTPWSLLQLFLQEEEEGTEVQWGVPGLRHLQILLVLGSRCAVSLILEFMPRGLGPVVWDLLLCWAAAQPTGKGNQLQCQLCAFRESMCIICWGSSNLPQLQHCVSWFEEFLILGFRKGRLLSLHPCNRKHQMQKRYSPWRVYIVYTGAPLAVATNLFYCMIWLFMFLIHTVCHRLQSSIWRDKLATQKMLQAKIGHDINETDSSSRRNKAGAKKVKFVPCLSSVMWNFLKFLP